MKSSLVEIMVYIRNVVEKFPRSLQWLAPIVSFLLIILPHIVPASRWLSFIALVPLFFFLEKSQSARRAFWGAYLFGFLYLGWTVRWLFAAAPSRWTGVTDQLLGEILVGAFWLFSSLTLGFAVGCFGYVYKRLPLNWRLYTIPFLWIIFEFARAWFYSIVWAGSEALIGPHWTFGLLGYSMSEFPLLLQLAKIGGVYGVGFVVALVNTLIFFAVVHMLRDKRFVITRAYLFGLVSVGLLLVGAMIYGHYVIQWSSLADEYAKKFSLIQVNQLLYQTAIPEQHKQYIDREVNLLYEAATLSPEVVVLPEASNLTVNFANQTSDIISHIFNGSTSTLVIDSGRMDPDNPSFARTFFYSSKDGLVAVSDKMLMVPNGEYLSYITKIPMQFFGLTDVVEHYDRRRRIRRGVTAPIAALDPRTLPEGVQLCTTIFSPSLWRNLTRESANILINAASIRLVNHISFHQQSRQIIRFHAVMNDRWFVQASNGGFSYIIDNTGSIRNRTWEFGDAVLTGDVMYRDTITPYVWFGDWPIGFALITVVASFGMSAYGRKNFRNQRG